MRQTSQPSINVQNLDKMEKVILDHSGVSNFYFGEVFPSAGLSIASLHWALSRS